MHWYANRNNWTQANSLYDKRVFCNKVGLRLEVPLSYLPARHLYLRVAPNHLAPKTKMPRLETGAFFCTRL